MPLAGHSERMKIGGLIFMGGRHGQVGNVEA